MKAGDGIEQANAPGREASGLQESRASADRHLEPWGYPEFARGFPSHSELDALVDAFTRGDYLTVRARAERLAANADVTPAIRAAAALLQARTSPDKAARYFFLFAAALLVFLSGWWITHDGPADDAPPAVKVVK